jgi:hypothetical protein
MQVDKDKVIALLGSGVAPGQVANAVGCDVSYISQLLAEPEFALKVAELRTADVLKYKEMDSNYDITEEKLLKKLNDLLPMMLKPDVVLRALAVVNNAKRRANSAMNNNVESGQVVKLQMPISIVNNYKINMVGGMVEVGGRDLTSMPSDVLMKSLESKNGGNSNEKEIQRLAAKSHASNLPAELVVNEKTV